MPAINIPMLVDIGFPRVLFAEGINDIDIAVPVDTTIKPGKTTDGLPSLDGRYYLNQDNDEIIGYLYIPQPSSLDILKIFIYNDNAQKWSKYLTPQKTFHSEGTVVKDGNTYNVYKFGENDEDFGWVATTINVSFTLA